MVSATLSGTSFPWIRTSHPCSSSVGNDVTGSKSCSMNQLDMFSFIKGWALHRAGTAGHRKVPRSRQLPGVSWTGYWAAQSNPNQLKKSIVKLPKFSGGISAGCVDKRFAFSPRWDNVCVITVSSYLMVFWGVCDSKYPGLSSFYLISESFIHRHYDEIAARTDFFVFW